MRVGIALGSNLGDRIGHLRAGVAAIRKLAMPPILVSRVYETEPVDCPPNSPTFLNAAMEIEYTGHLTALLEALQSIERNEGRLERREMNAPRPLDLDILYADDFKVESMNLNIPHPRMKDRLFVLLPLGDIAPNRKIPGGQLTIAEHISTLKIQDIKQCYLSLD